jgi:hypothetical protein
MGFLSGLFGGDKPQKQEPSQQERAQAESAARDYNRLATTFYPLQERMVDESRKDFTGLYTGRANADTAIAARDSVNSVLPQVLTTGNTSRLSQVNNTVAAGYGENMVNAKTRATNMKDGRQLNVIGVGYGLAADTNSGMKASAANEMSRTMTKLNADRQVSSARSAMIGQLAGSALTSAAVAAPTPNVNPITSTSQSQIVAPNTGANIDWSRFSGVT